MLNCTVMTFVERVVAFYRFVSCIEPIDVTEGSYLKSAVKKYGNLPESGELCLNGWSCRFMRTAYFDCIGYSCCIGKSNRCN